jgi:hypothetical protein
VQTVVQTLREHVPVAARESERQQRAVRDVEDGVGERHLLGQRRSRGARAHGLLGHDGERLKPGRRLEARRATVGADHKAAVQRCRDVVGVALELACVREHVGVDLEHVVGRHQPGDNRRRARAEPAREWDLRADLERELVGRMQPLERTDAEVLAAERDRQVGLD